MLSYLKQTQLGFEAFCDLMSWQQISVFNNPFVTSSKNGGIPVLN
jgi:hypothetical protein